MAIIKGTNGNDNLVGTAGDDTINAFKRIAPGIDKVNGGAGIDTLVVNASSETDGVQLFAGGFPTFQVRSNSGDFYVDAYNMERVIFTGGSGNDWINTGNHGGSVNGGAGVDYWLADLGAVATNIVFTLGTTTSIAAAGLSSIRNIERLNLTTGAGNDRITGGALADTIRTGAGNDTINAGKVPDSGVDFVDGGTGIDTLIVNASSETDAVQLFSGGFPTFRVLSNSGNFRVDAYNMEKVNFTSGAGNDTIDTGNHGGSVNGGTGIDYWTANLGAVATNIRFTLGTTTSIGAAGLSSILNIERINLTTGAGNDRITGGALADTIRTGAGNDTINAGKVPDSGVDFVDGGTGIDTLIVNASSETDAVQLFSGGFPTFRVLSNSGNFRVDAYNIEKIIFTGGSGNDTINTGNHGGSVRGGGGIDYWTADLGAVAANIVFTLGTTTSIAAAGLTSIFSIERIALTTGAGNDTITGGTRADTITTGAGNDTINAGKVIPGGAIDDVDGGAGIDTLVVNAAAETLGMQLSSGGFPTFRVLSNSGNFAVDAYNMEKVNFTGGAGNDTINTGNHGGRVNGGAGVDYWLADLGAVATNIVFTLGTTTSIASAGLTGIFNIERINLTTGGGDDSITGGARADTILTGAGNDTINAGKVIPGGAIDVVDGGAGIDTLVVNAATETLGMQLLSGGFPTFRVLSNSESYQIDAYNMEKVNFTSGSGNDLLNGGAANDLLTGGSGRDSFLFDTALNAATNVDRIFDFSSVNDTILLSGSIFTAISGSGTLSANQFFVGAAAHDADDRIIYNSGTGALIYDSNGNVAGGATQFAILTTAPALTNADFQIV